MSLPSFLTNLLAKPIITAVTDIVKDFNKTGVDKNKLEAEVKVAVLDAISKQAEHAAPVIIAEVNSQDKYVRRWRPTVAYGCAFILFFYAFILPVSVDWFGLPPVRVGDTLLGWIYTITLSALAGYGGLRTLEKISRDIVTKWR